MLLSAINWWSIPEHSLSNLCSFGRRPARTRVLCMVLYAVMMSVEDFVAIGAACMELES